MLVRSLTLATLLAVAGPLFAADSDAPLAKELGKARPLVVIAPSSADPTLRGSVTGQACVSPYCLDKPMTTDHGEKSDREPKPLHSRTGCVKVTVDFRAT